MSTGRDVSSIRLDVPSELPELTAGAAQALLRILRKAHGRQLGHDDNVADASPERDVA